MLLPNDMLVHEIICLKTKKVSPEKSLENSGTPGQNIGAQPNGHIEKWGVSMSEGSRGSVSSNPGLQPSRKLNHNLSLWRGKSDGVGKQVIF